MAVGSYTSYLGYPIDGSMARAIKVTYNIHENECNVKKTFNVEGAVRHKTKGFIGCFKNN